MNLSPLRLLIGLSLLAGTSASAQTSDTRAPVTYHVDTSINYSRGDYGLRDDTEVSLLLATATAETERWRFQALVPFLTVEGPAAIVAGGGAIPGRPTRSSETGLGDVILGATHKFGAVLGRTTLDLGAQLKLPTGSENRGLGTGESDVYVQADLRHPLGDITPFATLGYRFLGRSSVYPLRDGAFVSLGAVRTIGTTAVGASYNWRERIVRGGDHASEVLGFFLHPLNDRWRLQGYALAGFSEASPDFGTGLSLGYQF